uniref:ZP domain-containing protein n=1 Tax=Macrostomum lignano TaxID=282301 RepID=A0A1I8GA96_9PLAT
MRIIEYCQETRLTTILICTLCGPLCCCRAGDHPCVLDSQLDIDLTARDYQDERLVADLRNSKLSHCSWRFKVPSLAGSRTLVIEGIPGGSEPNNSSENQLQYELHDPTRMSFSRRPEEIKGHKPIVFRAVTPLAGFCSRDMLSFHGNCYAVNPVKETLDVSMRSIIGGAQLAYFNSTAEIKQFIAANNDRKTTYPFQRPLNLTQRVRIGVFLKEPDNSVVSIVREESGCGLKFIPGPERISLERVGGKCGYLELNERYGAMIEFGDCNEKLPALVTFPESAPVLCKNCSFSHDQHVSELLKSLNAAPKSQKNDTISSVTPTSEFWHDLIARKWSLKISEENNQDRSRRQTTESFLSSEQGSTNDPTVKTLIEDEMCEDSVFD